MLARSAALLLLLSPALLADAAAGRAAIDPEAVRRAVEHLASDALEGRGSGAEGGRAAAEWLAARFAELGVEPGGVEGSYFQPFGQGGLEMRNVVATLPGREPGEAVVIGAHYDHLGTHQEGALDFLSGRGKIHNGADDNASGTTAVLEIVRAFVASGVQPRRSVVFVLFDGEERGLLGSRHWVQHPTVPGKPVLMINLDMVGRLRKRLTLYGANTGDRLEAWVEEANAAVGLELDQRRALAPNSDHFSFYQAGVPVLAPFTGLHADYHRASDDAPKVNVEGIVQVARLSYGVAQLAADADATAIFAKAPDGQLEAAWEQVQAMLGLGDGEGLGRVGERVRELIAGLARGRGRARLGVTLDGLTVREVTGGSVAEKAGLRPGDRIVRFGGEEVGSIDALRRRVRAARGAVELEVVRGEAAQRLTAEFGGERKAQGEPR